MKTRLSTIIIAVLAIALPLSCSKDNDFDINNLPADALKGRFSVSKSKKVFFSKGNLVATIDASGKPTAWKFAANQYDCLGEGGANRTIGKVAGDVDYFGWSTAATSYGISASTLSEDYSGDFRDWGTAVDDNGTWRTLTRDEWTYLFRNHTHKWVKVNGVPGYAIAPDKFFGTIADSYKDDDELAAANLVFLPAAGYHYGFDVDFVGEYGYYWSSSVFDNDNAHDMYFTGSNVTPDYYDLRYCGYSVRLVTDVK